MKRLSLSAHAVPRARALRRQMTDAERTIWRALKASFPDHHFRKQVPFGSYIADFACHAAKLIIEVDGGQHAEQQVYDENRTAFLEDEGYRVLRFWNNDVLANTNGVMETISLSLREREGATKLRKGEGDQSPAPGRQTPSPSQG
jgi:very-short-patch-repair endonuclease